MREITAASATEATINLQGVDGITEVSVSLNPQVPPRIQGYEVTPPTDASASPGPVT